MYDREIKSSHPDSSCVDALPEKLPLLTAQQQCVVEALFNSYITVSNPLPELDRRMVDLRELKTPESIAKCQALLEHAFTFLCTDTLRSCETVSSNASSERAASLVGILLGNGAVSRYDTRFLSAAVTPLVNNFCRFMLIPDGFEKRQGEVGHHAFSLSSYFDHAPDRIAASVGVQAVLRQALCELASLGEESKVFSSIESVTALYHLVSLAERLRDSENIVSLEKS